MKSMGNSALVSHSKSVKHQKAVAAATESGTMLLQASGQRNVNVDTNNSNSQSVPANNSAKSNSSVNVTKTATLDTFFGMSQTKEEIFTSEILWTLYAINCNHSFNSNSDISDI